MTSTQQQEQAFAFAVEKPRVPVEEPAAIDENMISNAVQLERQLLLEEDAERQAQQKEDPLATDALQAKRLEEMELYELEGVALSFRKIHKIENLDAFTKLRTLQLDNNDIDKIQNLDKLTNLEWLDLSFNRIEKIEGLDNLTNLTDLSLANNNISNVDNLECLQNLEVLSLANNQINSMAEVTKLRQLPNLKVLCLDGNPVSHGEADIRGAVIARLPSLHYLDYKLVTDEERETAFTDHRADVEKLKRNEEQLKQKQKQEAEQQEYLKHVRSAGLERLYTIWSTMSEEDEDRERLMRIPDMDNMWNSYYEKVNKIIDDCLKEMMKIEEKMTAEKQDIDDALDVTKERADLKMQHRVDEFYRERKHTLRYLEEHDMEEEEEQEMLQKLKDKNHQMKSELLEEENTLNETRSSMLSAFETAFADFAVQRLETANKMFRAMEKEEQTFRDECKSHVLNMVERYAEGQPLITSQGVFKADDLEGETQALLQDREGAVATVGSSHDYRMSRILKQEDLFRVDEKQREKDTVHGRMSQEHNRNRARLDEIVSIVERNDREVDDVIAGLQQDEEI
eukprot:gb/GECG01000813.1/.p1 GENE.gb/GECG01000813.1/~~gb/GECG01000813.1/.p1  ORF type:complete len:569 (+),score=133.71 gb/GECG01000813.1/:1-1707(+)